MVRKKRSLTQWGINRKVKKDRKLRENIVTGMKEILKKEPLEIGEIQRRMIASRLVENEKEAAKLTKHLLKKGVVFHLARKRIGLGEAGEIQNQIFRLKLDAKKSTKKKPLYRFVEEEYVKDTGALFGPLGYKMEKNGVKRRRLGEDWAPYEPKSKGKNKRPLKIKRK